MSRLTIVRGLPGSGKSTYAKSLGIHHVEADMFWMNNGVYQFPQDDDPNKMRYLAMAHKWCYNQVRQAMWYGMDVVVSNTFTTVDQFASYLELAHILGYDAVVITRKNNFGSIHAVPVDVVDAMRNRWEEYPGETILITQNRRTR
jgi:predicted kinase